MDKLRECPFCGGEPICGMFRVWCDDCKAATHNEDTSISEEEIIRQWNTRADDDLLERAEKVLEEALANFKETDRKLLNCESGISLGIKQLLAELKARKRLTKVIQDITVEEQNG